MVRQLPGARSHCSTKSGMRSSRSSGSSRRSSATRSDGRSGIVTPRAAVRGTSAFQTARIAHGSTGSAPRRSKARANEPMSSSRRVSAAVTTLRARVRSSSPESTRSSATVAIVTSGWLIRTYVRPPPINIRKHHPVKPSCGCGNGPIHRERREWLMRRLLHNAQVRLRGRGLGVVGAAGAMRAHVSCNDSFGGGPNGGYSGSWAKDSSAPHCVQR